MANPEEGRPLQLRLTLHENEASVSVPSGAQPLAPAEAHALLRTRLQSAVDFEIAELQLTDNTSSFLSCRPTRKGPPGAWDVRIQRVFLQAGVETLHAVATYLSSASTTQARRNALSQLRAYFAQCPAPRANPRSERPLQPIGQAHDLSQILARLLTEPTFLTLRAEVLHITWGSWSARSSTRRQRRRKRQRTVQLGSYSAERKLIRIHPVLDQVDVPHSVVRTIVRHELLHALVPSEQSGRRRRIHTARFRDLERADPSFVADEAWIRRHIFQLLDGKRSQQRPAASDRLRKRLSFRRRVSRR